MSVKEFIKGVFTDNGNPSSSRIFGALCALTTIFCIVWVTVKTTHIPEATGTAALTAYGTSHYLVNRVSTAWGAKNTTADSSSTTDPSGASKIVASSTTNSAD
jgi:hypothetical protein